MLVAGGDHVAVNPLIQPQGFEQGDRRHAIEELLCLVLELLFG